MGDQSASGEVEEVQTPSSETTKDESPPEASDDDIGDPELETTCSEIQASQSESQGPVKDSLPESLPVPRWLEDDLEATAAETERDSVFSHAVPPYLHNAGSFYPIDRLSSLSGSAQPHRQRQHNLYIIFDMRKTSGSFVRAQEKTLPVDVTSAAVALNIDRDLIYPSSTRLQGLGMLVLAANRTEKYLLVKTEMDLYCLRINHDTTAEEIWEEVRAMCKLDRKQPHASGLHKDTQTLEDGLCAFSGECRLEPHDLLGLPSMAEIKVHHVRPFTWIVNYRWEQYCDKRYIVKCRNVDSLDEVKRTFLSVFSAVEKVSVDTDLNKVWFTFSDKVLTEKLRHEKCGMDAFRKVFSRYPQDMAIHRPYTIHLATPTSMEVYVHFQPADAILIEVKCKPEGIRALNEETVLPVSPTVSHQQLRLEVSKLVRQDLHSTRIYVGKKKVDDKTDLSKALRSRHCVITVEQKPKINLTIQVVHTPRCSAQETTFTLDIYSYDTVSKVKEEVCKRICVPQHRVDLYFENKLLDDDNTLNQNRLRNKDTIRAVVLTNRILLRVRSTSRRWHEAAVDDCFRSTVADVKAFVRSIEGPQNKEPDGEVVAIFKDKVLVDIAFLGDVGICPDRASTTLVFVKMESMCFTASSSCKGKFAVLQDFGDNTFQYVLAMSDAPVESETARKVDNLLKERRKMTWQQTGTVQGIREFSVAVREEISVHDRTPEPVVLRQQLVSGFISPVTTSNPRSRTADRGRLTPTSPGERGGEVAPSATRGRRSTRSRPSSVRFHTCEPDSDTCPRCTAHPDSSTDTSPATKLRASTSPDGTGVILAVRKSQSACLLGKPSSSPTDRPRSKSCPPLSARKKSQILRNIQLGCGEVQSDSESGYRKDVAFTRYRKNPDGNVTVQHVTKSEMSVPAHLVDLAIEACRSLAKPSTDLQESTGALLPYQSLESFNFGDLTYRYIKECIILQIANRIGTEGTMLVRRLGVTQDVIEKAEGKHPRDIAEQHLFCLRAWCRKEGAKANKHALKEALKNLDRNDLVELVDEIDSQSEG
ncbi:hypothetical protein BaRGS_00026666 [Batillaria attramentaria]|uniref:Death domain-containing protein n=1 Tax=Batillaria attramentaria TaxID=370345 RepID=A0ABD0K4T6_9CAEN